MNSFQKIAFVSSLFVATGMVHAQPDLYKSSFTLKQGSAFATSDPIFGAGATSVGRWNGENYQSMSITTTDFNTSTGQFSDSLESQIDFESGGNGSLFGTPLNLSSAAPSTGILAQTSVNASALSVVVNTQKTQGTGYAMTHWERSFVLDANASVNFSGVANLNYSDKAFETTSKFTPEQFRLLGGSNASKEAILNFSDVSGTLGVDLSASVYGQTRGIGPLRPDGSGSLEHASFDAKFSYSVTPEGLISITVTNPYNTALNGSFSADTWARIVTPAAANAYAVSAVPEPAEYLSLMVGLGIVGAMAKRKRAEKYSA
jgi:hypothetical protein